MNLLYDLITILPYSLLLLLFCGGYAGIPEDGILPYVLTLLLPAGLTVLRHMKPRNRLRSIGITAAFLAGLLLAAGEENRLLLIETYFWTLWIMCFSAAAVLAGILT
ncbi:MAG: hypothetical protein IKN55_05345, partial [Oscillospiraceae bacterium]|nr:hypothetical protein [Oscillospiraceae bacterium]